MTRTDSPTRAPFCELDDRALDEVVGGASIGIYGSFGYNTITKGGGETIALGLRDSFPFVTGGIYHTDATGLSNGISAGVSGGFFSATGVATAAHPNDGNADSLFLGPGYQMSVGAALLVKGGFEAGGNSGGTFAGLNLGVGASLPTGIQVTSMHTETTPSTFSLGSNHANDPTFDARWNSDVNALNHANDPTFDARWNSDMNALNTANHANDPTFDARWNSDMNALAGGDHTTLPPSIQNEFGLSPTGQPLGVDHSNGANPFDPGAVHSTELPPGIQSEFGLSPTGQPLGVDHSNGANPFDSGHATGTTPDAGTGAVHSDAGTVPITVAANDTSHTDTGAVHVDDNTVHVDPAPVVASPPPVVASPPPILDTPPPMIDIPTMPVFIPPDPVITPPPAPIVVANTDPIPMPVIVPPNPIVDTTPTGDSGGSFDVAGDFGDDGGGGGGFGDVG